MKNKKLRHLLILFFLLVLSGNVMVQGVPSILIAYYSGSGNTQTMAEAVASGVAQVEHVNYTIKRVEELSGRS